jgi:dTDP-4-dehydrorhamnose 3,5-epimerase-like enzyme
MLELPQIHDGRGNLTFIEGCRHVPFDIKRVYYLYDVPSGSVRAGHAHKQLQQVLIAVAGSFDVMADDGRHRVTYHLNRPFRGLHVPAMVWREISNFSSGSVCMAIASDLFEEADYYREYGEFLRSVGAPPR